MDLCMTGMLQCRLMKAVSSKTARDRSVILDVLRRLGPLSRVDIHNLTHLRPGTISSIVRELLVEGHLREAGLSDNPMGRKQVLLEFNQAHGCIVAVEFDAARVVAAVLDLGARIQYSLSEPACLTGGVDGLVEQLVACARKAIAGAGVDPSTLVAMGVADPGLVDTANGVSVVTSTIDFWRQVPLQEIFQREFPVPFLLESDTRARTVAERLRGAGAMARDMLYLDYGTGIGLGVITEGRLLRGHSECAGEFGHMHVLEGGPPCKCGSFGCLEAIAGVSAIASRARTAVENGGTSQVLELAGGVASRITGADVVQAAALGDKMCAAIVGEAEKYIGLALANVVNLLNPELVVVDRRLGAADPVLLDQIARIVRRQSLFVSSQGLRFSFSQLGPEAGVMGIALMLLDRLFEIPALKPPKFMTEPTLAAAR